jgi:DNA polymerase-3 subunit gamma/tau
MLFAGPAACGKGTAALELGRIFSCEKKGASWNCVCPACIAHRNLAHGDLVAMGPRPFGAEIFAAKETFLRDISAASSRILFFRSLRKLLLRFSPVLWNDDPKITKVNTILETINEELEDLSLLCETESEKPEKRQEKIIKLCEKITVNAAKLEADGIGDTIPVSQIRSASYWLHIAPAGTRKLLVIENADRMQDGARNSLLKVLEEPPETCAIILCSSRPEALLPTILSRLRPYRFEQREAASEIEIIRRVFKDGEGAIPPHGKTESGITAYLDKFLPVSKQELYPLSGFFWASIAYGATRIFRARGVPDAQLPPLLLAVGRYGAAVSQKANLGRPVPDTKSICAELLKGADNFSGRGAFSVFLGLLCSSLSEALNAARNDSPDSDTAPALSYRKTLLRHVEQARVASSIFKQSPALVLERLCCELQRGFSDS